MLLIHPSLDVSFHGGSFPVANLFSGLGVENKSANEASLAVVWEGEKVAPCFSTFFAFFPLWSLVSGYNVIYFAHLNSCERTHVFHKLVLTT